MDDTWGPRDLPVLDAAVRLSDAKPGIGGTFEEIAADTGLDLDTVYVSARALRDDGLVNVSYVSRPTHNRIDAVSGRARQLVGAWPSGESGADRLIALLEREIANAPTDVQRTKLQDFRDGAAGVGRDVLVALVAKMLTGG